MCNELKTLNVINFDTSKVRNMRGMFKECFCLKTLDLSSFNTGKVEDMDSMFYGCWELETLDLSSFNTSAVSNVSDMFSGCEKLKILDLSSFDLSNADSGDYFFTLCKNLETIFVSERWNSEHVEQFDSMFMGCEKLTGGYGTKYDSAFTDGYMACIDSVDGSGYLTGVYGLKVHDGLEVVSSSVERLSAGYAANSTVSFQLKSGETADAMVLFNGEEIFPDQEGIYTVRMPWKDSTIILGCGGAYLEGDMLFLTGNVSRDVLNAFADGGEVKKVIAWKSAVLPADCSSLFSSFSKVTQIDLSQIDASNVTNYDGMFADCAKLEKVYVSSSWNATGENLFQGAGTDRVTAVYDLTLPAVMKIVEDAGESYRYGDGYLQGAVVTFATIDGVKLGKVMMNGKTELMMDEQSGTYSISVENSDVTVTVEILASVGFDSGTMYLFGSFSPEDVKNFENISNKTAMSGVVKLNVTVDDDGMVVSLRGYMILKEDATGNLVTYYTGMKEGSYASVNGN